MPLFYGRIRLVDESCGADQKRFVFNKLTGRLVLTKVPQRFQKSRRRPWLLTGTTSPTAVWIHEGKLPRDPAFYWFLHEKIGLAMQTPIKRSLVGKTKNYGALKDFAWPPTWRRDAAAFMLGAMEKTHGKPRA